MTTTMDIKTTSQIAGAVWARFRSWLDTLPVRIQEEEFGSRAWAPRTGGRRCIWTSRAVGDVAIVTTIAVVSQAMEVHRDTLDFDIYDGTPETPARPELMASLGFDLLQAELQKRLDAVAAVARLQDVELSAENTTLFLFGHLLAKGWDDEVFFAPHRWYCSGRAEIGLVVTGPPALG